jgi:hypothetical protein
MPDFGALHLRGHKLDLYRDAVIHYMTHNKDGSQILQTKGAIALITELLDS